jgi:hypothetical protein
MNALPPRRGEWCPQRMRNFWQQRSVLDRLRRIR